MGPSRSSCVALKKMKVGISRTRSEFIADDTDEDSPFWGRRLPHFGYATNRGDAPNSLPFQRVRGCRSCQENSMSSARLSISPDSRKSFCVAIRPIDRNMRRSCAAPKATEQLSGARRWPGSGGWTFPCAPDRPAAVEPAIWLAALSPTTVVLDTADPDLGVATSVDLDDWPLILVDRQLSNGRHLVLADTDGPHRLWLRDTSPGRPLAYVIAKDASLDLRLAAVRRLERRLVGAPPAKLPRGFTPTDFQRHKLSLLLDILDMMKDRGHPEATTYDIARTLLYVDMGVGRGSDWKNSSERRRTQRLIEEAFALRDGGYRVLLRG